MEPNDPVVAQIGETAGAVWQALMADGPMSVAKLVREVDAPRDTVMQALGWLAREGKLMVSETSRGRLVQLRGE
ncbi:MAG: winged helix-turn-helix domain-containing protein [Pirellulaceae bacterium]|nr:winged helix-turn-helix domain-containing protein [Planctomycetales bacterium]